MEACLNPRCFSASCAWREKDVANEVFEGQIERESLLGLRVTQPVKEVRIDQDYSVLALIAEFGSFCSERYDLLAPRHLTTGLPDVLSDCVHLRRRRTTVAGPLNVEGKRLLRGVHGLVKQSVVDVGRVLPFRRMCAGPRTDRRR
jgi:hypothetical protein